MASVGRGERARNRTGGRGHRLGLGVARRAREPRQPEGDAVLCGGGTALSGDSGLTFGSAVALGAVSVTIATLVHIAVVAAGASAHDWVADAARTRTVRRLLAVGLAAVALWFLIG